MMQVSPTSLHALRGEAGQATAALLHPWVEAGILRSAEVALAARIATLDGPPEPAIVLAFALALRAERSGSALVDLAEVDVAAMLLERSDDDGVDAPAPVLPLPWPAWGERLCSRPRLVAPARGGTPGTPFVLEGSRLLTARAYLAETRIVEGVERLHLHAPSTSSAPSASDTLERRWAAVEAGVQTLVVGEGAAQQWAAARSVVHGGRLQIVTGGPGTGKTYTVRAMLTLAWLRHSLERPHEPALVAHLAAPTGKAAQRMKEAMGNGLDAWCEAVAANVASAMASSTLDTASLRQGLHDFLANLATSTLHRLLGYRAFNPTRFRHDRENPLPSDLVVVDEASMVDLAMMAHLMHAVPDHARLVLVGDRRQLASVETGTVLADLCAWSHTVDGPLVSLSASRRFPPESPVGQFAAAAERLDAFESAVDAERLERAARDAVRALVDASERREMVRWVDRHGPDVPPPASGSPGAEGGALRKELQSVARMWMEVMQALDACVLTLSEDGALTLPTSEAATRLVALAYGGAAHAPDAPPGLGELFTRLSERVRVLAAHREGRRGVAGLNEEIWRRIQRLARNTSSPPLRNVLGRGLSDPAVGKPILVTRNDYGLRRFNGDVGLWAKVQRSRSPEDPPTLMAIFPSQSGGVDAHGSARLPEHEPVWAMSVHKSQGSEFERVLFVFPAASTSLWTRELVYTGITRVKRELILAGEEEVLVAGLKQRIRRASGLTQRLCDTS